MYIENIVIGKPLVNEVGIFSKDSNDWINIEQLKTYYTEERFLPKLLVECGIVKSVSEVLRNKPQFKITLNEYDYIEIKWGKRKLFILVGGVNCEDSFLRY